MSSGGGKKMELFSRFSWAVPSAFAAAVSSCRFEQGDVLYSDAGAYENSSGADAGKGAYLQILDPPRSARALTSEGEGQRFFANWESSVEFEWMDYETGRREERSSTQGRIFTCLWRGEPAWLEPESESPDPPRPLLLRDLHNRIEESIPAFASRFKRTRKKAGAAGKYMLFVLATDYAGDASRVKAESVLAALRVGIELTSCDLSPEKAKIGDGDCFHPSLFVRGIAIESQNSEAVQATLKALLYGGSKDPDSEDARFQLARHGALVEFE